MTNINAHTQIHKCICVCELIFVVPSLFLITYYDRNTSTTFDSFLLTEASWKSKSKETILRNKVLRNYFQILYRLITKTNQMFSFKTLLPITKGPWGESRKAKFQIDTWTVRGGLKDNMNELIDVLNDGCFMFNIN